MSQTTVAHARLLVIAAGGPDAELVADFLREEFDKVETSSDHDDGVADFDRVKPQLLILAHSQLADAEAFHRELMTRSALAHTLPHHTLILCNRQDAGRAYDLCRKQKFDDYVVFWAATYDPHRLRMSALLAVRANQLASRNGPSAAQCAAQAARTAEIAERLGKQLDRGQRLMEQFHQHIQDTEAALNQALTGFSGRLDDSPLLRTFATERAEVRSEIERLREEYLRQAFAQAQVELAGLQGQTTTAQTDSAPSIAAAESLQRATAHARPVVLIVDDDGFQRRLLSAMLSDLALETCEASGVSEAMALLRHLVPDLILLDFQLPDGTGVQLVQQLKLLPALAAVPVILITGTGTKEVLMESHHAGASDFMVKPLDRSRLRASVQKYLKLAPEPRKGG